MFDFEHEQLSYQYCCEINTSQLFLSVESTPYKYICFDYTFFLLNFKTILFKQIVFSKEKYSTPI